MIDASETREEDEDFENAIDPVSYTHLDVYKRQVINCFRCSSSVPISAIADFRFPKALSSFSVLPSWKAVPRYLAKC